MIELLFNILNALIDVLLLLVILVVLVVIHEVGHFVVARRARVQVHEFGIGFPPRAKVLGHDGETLYTLNWLPLGGFVRLEGEEGESDNPRSFVRQKLSTRLIILLAGVAMNFLLAFLVFAFIAGTADPVRYVRVAAVEPGSPADETGLQGGQVVGTDAEGNPIYDESGDLIVAIDGNRFPMFDRFEDFLPAVTYMRERAGQQVTLTVRDAAGEERTAQATLRHPGPDQGPLGIVIHQRLVLDEIRHDPLTALGLGARRTLDASTLILRAVGQFITNLTDPPVAGPIGIVGAIGTVRAELPPIFLVFLVGLLSANLAVINALPFPPLDGGRVAVALIQAVSNNRISEAAERLVYLAGFILLIMLIVWISYFDIARQLGGGT